MVGSDYRLFELYNPFGTERSSWSSTSADGEAESQKTYIGEYSDKESGLSYLNARYYNPATGQFLSQDPWEGDYTDPQSLNKYAYSRNNPINYIDPDGEYAVLVEAGIGIVAFAGAYGLAAIAQQTFIPSVPQIDLSWMNFDPMGLTAYEQAIGPDINQYSGCGGMFICVGSGGGSSWGDIYSLDRPMPGFDERGNPILDEGVVGPHTQLGTKDGSKVGEYSQGREIDEGGKIGKRIDFTDHGDPDNHTNPHQHKYNENSTGGSRNIGDAEPVE